MPFYKLTNTTDGPRGIYTLNGFAVAAPGETIAVEASADDVKANKDFFKSESAKEADVPEAPATELERINPPEPLEEVTDQFDTMQDEQLRDYIEDRDGKRPHHKASRDTLLKQARADKDAD